MAAISHFFGSFAALIIWATQKDKSRFVRFQATQAMVFNLLATIILSFTIVSMITITIITLSIGIGDIAIFSSQGNPIAELFRTLIAGLAGVPLLIPCVLIPMIGIILVARLIAAIQNYSGKNFHYPWLGSLIERNQAQ